MARYHTNPETGNVGPCTAEKKCPFGDLQADHYDTPEAAREAFEAKQDTFAVVLKKSDGDGREVNSFDANIAQRMARAFQEYEDAADKAKWIEDKVMVLDGAQTALDRTLPGTVERSEALTSRTAAREELLAADLVMWRESPFYNEAVEARMKETTVNVSDADSSIEEALADNTAKAAVANEFGISTRDVDNILEVAHRDYLRPRAPLASSIGDLSTNANYAADTAYVFRVEPAAVQGVLNYAANYSQVQASGADRNSMASLADWA